MYETIFHFHHATTEIKSLYNNNNNNNRIIELMIKLEFLFQRLMQRDFFLKFQLHLIMRFSTRLEYIVF